jgi:hypothetical protein
MQVEPQLGDPLSASLQKYFSWHPSLHISLHYLEILVKEFLSCWDPRTHTNPGTMWRLESLRNVVKEGVKDFATSALTEAKIAVQEVIKAGCNWRQRSAGATVVPGYYYRNPTAMWLLCRAHPSCSRPLSGFVRSESGQQQIGKTVRTRRKG